MERKFANPFNRIFPEVKLGRLAIFVTAGLAGAELAFKMTEDPRITVLAGVLAACAIDEARMSSKGE